MSDDDNSGQVILDMAIDDTAIGLSPTENCTMYRSEVEKMIDVVQMYTRDVIDRSNKWNQIIMVISSGGALITSILAIGGYRGWPYEIFPIIVQTLAAVISSWVNYYGYPEEIRKCSEFTKDAGTTLTKLLSMKGLDNEIVEEVSNLVSRYCLISTIRARNKYFRNALIAKVKETKYDKQMKDLLEKGVNDILSDTLSDDTTTFKRACNTDQTANNANIASLYAMLKDPEFKRLMMQENQLPTKEIQSEESKMNEGYNSGESGSGNSSTGM